MKVQTFILGLMQTNCYFLSDGNEAAVVDPAAECSKILNKLAERGLKLKYILLTHSHFDHMMALDELREAAGAPLCVHKLDAPALTDPRLSYMLQFGGLDRPSRPADILLEDGDIIQIGGSELKVMHTPGHTLGSVCYIAGDNIISGDTLFKGNIGRYDLYGGNYARLLESLKLLTALEGDYKVYPGHGASTRLSVEKANNIYLS